MENKMMLTVEEFQKLWGISRPKAYELVNSDGFPSLRVGRKILIPMNQLEKWVERQTKEVAAAQ